MNNLKTKIIKNKKIVIGIVVAVLLIGGIGGYFLYDNNRKTEIMNKMSITFTDKTEIEYGTKDFDVKKELVKDIKDAELTDVPKLDTTKIGEITLKFNLKKDDVVKEVEHTIKVVDTRAPEITLEVDSKNLTVGDEYDIKSNVKSVTDVVDGDIPLVEDAKTLNEKATEEYSKLKKEEITDETVIAEKKVSDFFIETIKGEDDKEVTTLYLKNCYYVDGSVDVAIAGEYNINIFAIDKNGIKLTKQFTVGVKEKEVEKPVSSNGGGYSSGGGYASNGGGGSSSSGGGSSIGAKQGISAVINSALAQVGTPYVWGGSAPGGFDCSGFIYWSFVSNGYSVPRSVNSAGSSIGVNLANAQAGDILAYSGHSNLITSIIPCGQDEGMTVYSFSYVTAQDGVGVVSKNSPTIIRQDGKVLQGSQDWYDIRRVR